jgi:hypothetical protein
MFWRTMFLYGKLKMLPNSKLTNIQILTFVLKYLNKNERNLNLCCSCVTKSSWTLTRLSVRLRRHGSTFFRYHATASFCNTFIAASVMILTYVYNEDWHIWYRVRFQVLTAATINFRVFSDILSCSQIDVDIYLTTLQYVQEHYELHCGYHLLFCNSELFWLCSTSSSSSYSKLHLPVQLIANSNSSALHWMLIVFFCKHSHFFLNNNSFNNLKQRLLYNLYCLHIYLTVNKLLV